MDHYTSSVAVFTKLATGWDVDIKLSPWIQCDRTNLTTWYQADYMVSVWLPGTNLTTWHQSDYLASIWLPGPIWLPGTNTAT